MLQILSLISMLNELFLTCCQTKRNTCRLQCQIWTNAWPLCERFHYIQRWKVSLAKLGKASTTSSPQERILSESSFSKSLSWPFSSKYFLLIVSLELFTLFQDLVSPVLYTRLIAGDTFYPPTFFFPQHPQKRINCATHDISVFRETSVKVRGRKRGWRVGGDRKRWHEPREASDQRHLSDKLFAILKQEVT